MDLSKPRSQAEEIRRLKDTNAELRLDLFRLALTILGEEAKLRGKAYVWTFEILAEEVNKLRMDRARLLLLLEGMKSEEKSKKIREVPWW